MEKRKKRSSGKLIWTASAAIALILVSGGALVAKILIADDEGKRRQVVQMVTLIQPPPPPPIREKPPEPEIKKQEIVEDKKEEAKEEDSKETDDAPAGDQLGLDADGDAGSDAFGLVGKKGGRALLGGDPGGELMQRYAWYMALIQEELRKKIKKQLDESGGIPGGRLEAIVRIIMDEAGGIVDFSIVGSSGNRAMDEAVREALASARIHEAPPQGMPRAMKIRISSQG